MKKTMKKSIKNSSGSCKVMKKLPDPSPQKINSFKKILFCADNKCKEFLDKDIEITEKCLDKLNSMKINTLSDERRLKVEDDCLKKFNLVPNTLDKINCLNKKCTKELKHTQRVGLVYNLDKIRDFSNYEKEKHRIAQKREKFFPELKKVNKLTAKRNLLEIALETCKNESQRKKLKSQISKLDSQVSKFYSK